MSEQGKNNKSLREYVTQPRKKLLSTIVALFNENEQLKHHLNVSNNIVKHISSRPLVKVQILVDSAILNIKQKIKRETIQK